MNLFCVGISHHTANVETRERYAATCSKEALQEATGCREALTLATCNRVEVYVSAEQSIATEEVLRVLQRCGGDEVENADVLDGINLSIGQGEVFALLGPNGAGKTTTVQILSTLIAGGRRQRECHGS